MIKSKIRNFALFSINARCNDSCQFCLKYNFIKKSYPELTLSEIKDNYFFMKRLFNIQYVVLSGGEPTLHQHFFDILNFFQSQKVKVMVITNLLKISRDKKFFNIFKKYFPGNGHNIIAASINDLPTKSRSAQSRIKGLIKVLKARLRFSLITLIYKDNIEDLPGLANLLQDSIKKYFLDSQSVIEIEIRFLYFSETPKLILKKSLPKSSDLKINLNKFLGIWYNSKLNIVITPWRLPLCYIDNFQNIRLTALDSRINSRYFLVDKEHQFKKIKILEVFRLRAGCQECLLRNSCAAGEYLFFQKKYNLPPIFPIKKI